MDNPVLAELISDVRLLLDNPDLVQRLLDHTHARIDHYAARIDEATAQLEVLRQLQVIQGLLEQLGETATTTEEEEDTGSTVESVEALLGAFLRQRSKLTQVLAFLLLVRAVAYARSRSRLVPGVLLAAASAAVFPGFRTLVRLSVLTLGFLFASDLPPADG
ncbi:unnamed protein product [Alopecurus aequalis]